LFTDIPEEFRKVAQHVAHVDNNLISTYVDKIYHLVNERQLGKRILDAGCGPEHYTNAFTARGFDTFYDLPFEDGYFSAVFCMAAFQHVPIEGDVALKTLRGFYRVLWGGLRYELHDTKIGSDRFKHRNDIGYTI